MYGDVAVCPLVKALTPVPEQVDGSERQRGNTSAMIHSIPDMLSFVSSCMTLNPGDVILTGTPSGVGPVFPGQTITIGISGITEASFPVISG